ncbi:MAG TPA: SLC13 family permease [Nitrospira sp.]|nr:SLC13 family permease [Nitrospira sp.]
MSELQIYITMAVFGAVILAIAFDVIDMAVATLLGVSVLFGFNILAEDDVIAAMRTAGGPLSLLFGGMVVARTLASTGIFDRIGASYLHATKGSGKRFLLLLVALVAPLCAFLPNATTVILLAPIIIRVATALEVDFVGPMVLTAMVSNSAGLLTLVGDPATFLVGSSIGMSFGQYLHKVSLGGLLSLLVLIPLLPLLMPDLWRLQRQLPPQVTEKRFQRRWFALLAFAVLAIMIGLFLFGEDLPDPIGPPAVAIISASLALLVIYGAKIEPIDNVLRDIDWKTLVFLGCIFFLVQAITKTGLLQSFSLKLYDWFGTEFWLAALALIAGIGLLSSLLANIPVVAASIFMVKGYLVAVEAVPEAALGASFTDWPVAIIPVFVAMMFGATLGGNATLIGASANIVSVGICARNGKPVTFITWLRYGLPITACQLAVSALYVLVLFYFMR